MNNNRRKRPGARRPGADGSRWIRLCAAAAVILVIGAIAVLALNGRKGKGTEEPKGGVEIEVQQSGTAAQEAEPEASQEGAAVSQNELKKDAVPEVNQLLGDYFQAKVDQDAQALFRIFGKTEDGDLEKLRSELAYEAKVIEDYQDITCYTKPGLWEDSSYVVYVTYFVKYKKTDTLAPGLMWCYVVRQEDGSWIIRENVLGDEADHVAKCNQSEEVKALSSQVNEALKEALESDSILAGYYQDLRNGAMVQESDYDSSVSVMTEPGSEGSAASQEGTGAEDGTVSQESTGAEDDTAPQESTDGESVSAENGQDGDGSQAEDTSQASEVKIGQ